MESPLTSFFLFYPFRKFYSASVNAFNRRHNLSSASAANTGNLNPTPLHIQNH